MAGNEILAVGQEAIDKLAEEENNKSVEEANTDKEVTQEEQETVVAEVEESSDAVSEDVDKEVEVESEDDSYYFGDTKVDIEVPAEISSALKEAKVDEQQLIKELFAKDGKFELSDKTRAALDKAFGKTIVDGYLGLYRQQNQMTMEAAKKAADEAQKQVQANTEDFQKLTGGDEGWSELADWAGENLPENEIAQFNAVMSLPAEHYQAQRAVVEALQLKRLHGMGEKGGDPSVELLSDGGSASTVRDTGGVPAQMTREQFHEAMYDPRYRNDPKYQAAVDASRQRGINAEAAARRK